MKIEIELTPEIEELIRGAHVAVEYKHGILQLKEAIEKAKNRIKPGDLAKRFHVGGIFYFIAEERINNIHISCKGGGYEFIEKCTKATPAEEKIIKPLLSKE